MLHDHQFIQYLTVTEMPFKVYFKSVETIVVAANSAGLSKGEEVEITDQVNKASKEVTKKRKK